MQVTFCRNQVMTAQGNSSSAMYSEPIRLGPANRLTANVVVSYIYGGGGPAGRLFAVSVEVSNDGANFAPAGNVAAGVADAGTTVPASVDVRAIWCRLKYMLAFTAAGDGAIGFTVAGVIEQV